MAPSEEKKIALRKKKDILPQGKKFPCARREISVRTKKYFRAHENFPPSHSVLTLCSQDETVV